MPQEGANLARINKEIVLSNWRPQAPRQATDAEGVEAYSSFPSYRRILVKHRWLILAIAFVLTALISIYSFVTQPIYRSTARILVGPDNPEVRTMEDLFRSASPNDDNFLATQVNVLQSDNLAKRTIEHLELTKSPEFAKYAQHRNDNSKSRVESGTQLIEAFKQRLVVERQRDTRMIEVSFESDNPELAARIVNSHVNNYIEYNFQMKYDSARQTAGWMQQQLDELKNKVEQSQQALVDYERQNSIVNVGDKESVAEQKLGDLSRDLTQAQSDRIEKESIFELTTSTKSQVGLVAQNDLLQKLEEKDSDLREQYVGALAQYGEAFPKVVRLRGQIDELQKLIEHARKRMIERSQNDFNASKTREALLTAAVATQKAEVGKFNQLLIQHNMLKREFETNQQLYESLLQRLKDATVSAGLRATNVHLVDEGVPAQVPVRPRKLRNSFTGLLAGLILGVVAALVREALDNSINGAEEVENLIAAPALAIIPSQNGHRSGVYGHHQSEVNSTKGNVLSVVSFFKSLAPNWSGSKIELAILREPSSPISESFRALRTSILFSTEQPPKTVLVTSAQPMEGKTSVSLNLAFTLAQKGGRVLIVDADFRRPGITLLLGLTEGAGLSNVLARTHNLEECIGMQRLDHDGQPALRKLKLPDNLWVLPTGPLPPDPVDLLSSSSMDCLLRAMHQRFDHVIIDSPPVLPFTDATILSRMVDGVVMVVENERTSRGAVLRACRIITNCGGRILGAALNKVVARRDDSYGSYGYECYEGGTAYTKRGGHRDS